MPPLLQLSSGPPPRFETHKIEAGDWARSKLGQAGNGLVRAAGELDSRLHPPAPKAPPACEVSRNHIEPRWRRRRYRDGGAAAQLAALLDAEQPCPAAQPGHDFILSQSDLWEPSFFPRQARTMFHSSRRPCWTSTSHLAHRVSLAASPCSASNPPAGCQPVSSFQLQDRTRGGWGGGNSTASCLACN